MKSFPVFKRLMMSVDSSHYYAQNTDIWVHGKSKQYKRLIKCLGNTSESIRVIADERGGMDVLVLPPATGAMRDFIVLHERLVYQSGRFNMELIFGGTAKGYKKLAGHFKHMIKYGAGDIHNHSHVDDYSEPLLLIPSVYLNVRAPIENADSLLPSIASSTSDDLLPDMNWREPENWEYTLIETYGNLYGKLPLNRKGLRMKIRQGG